MRFYIGCPIDTAKTDPHAELQEAAGIITKCLPTAIIFNPLTAFINAHNMEDHDALFIRRVNEFAIREVDHALFIWNGCPSFGLPLEMELCTEEGIPFILWNKTDRRLGLYMRQVMHANEEGAVVVLSQESLEEELKKLLDEPLTSEL